jgi:geranylgeranyl diphosphate synthase type II
MARELSIAFQIRDDVLNLGAAGPYGKETNGDLWEGKRTLIVLHMMRSLGARDRAEACRIFAKRRPVPSAMAAIYAELEASGDLTRRGRERLEANADAKSAPDIEQVLAWIAACGSLDYARSVGDAHAKRAGDALSRAELRASPHRELLHALVDFTTTREH